jgi:hypothetical protein
VAAEGPSLADAFGVLESHASSSRAHASLKTLRAEMESVMDKPKAKPPQSPGQRAAARAPGSSFDRNAGKLAAITRMKEGNK